jgi:hypothetical protein
VEKRTNIAPSRVAGADILCRIKPYDFQMAMERVALKGRKSNGRSYTVVAICGTEENVFEVPALGTFDLNALPEHSPGAAQIVQLYSEVQKRLFSNDPLNAGKPSKDKELQATAQKLLPVLKSGKFDKGFGGGRLKELFITYQGPVSGMRPVPKLVNYEKWTFLSYVDPAYPPVPKPNGIDPRVELELSVDLAGGYVRSLRITRGDRFYTTVSTDAAVQWKFDPAQRLDNPIKLTLDYSLPCRTTIPKH